MKSSDKRYPCPFCEKQLAKLPRHLRSAHKNEDNLDLKKYLATGDGAALTKLRNKGRHEWNQKVRETGRGMVEPVYRSKSFHTHNDLGTCLHCLGWFGSNELWRHITRCRANQLNIVERNPKRIGRMLRDSHVRSSNKFRDVMSTFKDDHVTLVVKNDPLIKEWGERLCLTHGHSKTRYRNIRSRLRRVAHVLLKLRELDPNIVKFTDSIKADNYNLFMLAAQRMAGFKSDINTYLTPHKALKIGTDLIHLLDVHYTLVIEQEEQVRQCQLLKRVMEIRWHTEINASAHRTIAERKMNKVELLPLSADVCKLSTHLKARIISLCDILNKQPSISDYVALQRNLLVSITMFNRKRSGEVAEMTTNDYQHPANTQSESLTTTQQQLAKSFHRFVIKGKTIPVPILLSDEMKRALDLLIKLRGQFNIYHNYIFGAMKGSGPLRGCEVIKSITEEAGLAHPERIRTTKLRKHIATMSQVVNLKDHELDGLAKFLGHDVRTHRKIYRLDDAAFQTALLSKLLLAVESGNMHHGKTLEEIRTECKILNKIIIAFIIMVQVSSY